MFLQNWIINFPTVDFLPNFKIEGMMSTYWNKKIHFKKHYGDEQYFKNLTNNFNLISKL